MDSETPDSLIPYDEIINDALRAVVGHVLSEVAVSGLPGKHHFYIAFKTQYPGVDIPKHLLERYPDEMTIVINNRFWDLQVEEDHFSVGLSFNQVPAKLVVPFDAVVGFVDPSVNFALQFQPKDADGEMQIDEQDEEEEEGEAPAPPPAPITDGSNVVTLDAFRKK